MVKTFEVTLVLKLTPATTTSPVRILGRGGIFLRRLFHLRTVSICTTFVAALCSLRCRYILALDHVQFLALGWGRQWMAGTQGTNSISLSTWNSNLFPMLHFLDFWCRSRYRVNLNRRGEGGLETLELINKARPICLPNIRRSALGNESCIHWHKNLLLLQLKKKIISEFCFITRCDVLLNFDYAQPRRRRLEW